jgi:hypothetical protein
MLTGHFTTAKPGFTKINKGRKAPNINTEISRTDILPIVIPSLYLGFYCQIYVLGSLRAIAKQSQKHSRDCFVAWLLAMTEMKGQGKPQEAREA